MELIDVLCQEKGEAATFTVDNTQTDVPIVLGGGLLVDPVGNIFFDWQDNFTILSVGLVLPYGLTLAEPVAPSARNVSSVFLEYMQQSFPGIWYGIPSTTSGNLTLPLDNYEMSVGAFVDASNLIGGGIGERWALRAMLTGEERVSMLGVPSAMNGKVLSVPVFVKVLHNLQLLP